MKAYIICPPFEMFGVQDERTSDAIDLIADIVFQSLRSGGDTFQYSVVRTNRGKESGAMNNEDIATPHILQLDTEEALRNWLRESLNPNAPGGGTVRSIATCRCATFGYDGQAFLCLRLEDEPPVSPNLGLAVVEERTELITQSDYFDGLVPNSG